MEDDISDEELPNFSIKFNFQENSVDEALVSGEELRFASLTDAEMENILENRHSVKTKKNTKWAIKTFQGTSISSQIAHFMTILNVSILKLVADLSPECLL